MLQGICRALAVEYRQLPGVTLAAKAGALVEMLGVNGRLPELATQLIKRQPQLANKYRANPARSDWIDDMTAGENPLADTMITMQWPGERERREETAWLAQNLTEVRRQVSDDVTIDVGSLGLQERRQRLPNPYQPGQPVADPLLFFGREPLLRQLVEAVQQHQSVALVAPPQLGKTSLLWQLQQWPLLPPPVLLAYGDLQAEGPLPTLLNQIFGQWIRQIGSAAALPKLAHWADFERWVRALNTKGFYPVLCLDGVAEGAWVEWEQLLAEGLLTVVTASRRPLADLGLTPTLHRRLQRLDVGLLSETAVADLLTLPLARAGLTAPAGLVEQLHKLCGCHPLYLQLAGHLLFAGLAVQSYSWATLRDTFLAQAQPHWQALWQSLSTGQQVALQTAVGRGPFPAAMERTARVLLQQGLFVKEGGDYRPFSQGFADWLRTH